MERSFHKKPTGEEERPTPHPKVVSLRYWRYRKKWRAAGAQTRKCLQTIFDAAYGLGDMLHGAIMTARITILGVLAVVHVHALEFFSRIWEKVRRRNL